jgi:hypothetical protein
LFRSIDHKVAHSPMQNIERVSGQCQQAHRSAEGREDLCPSSFP